MVAGPVPATTLADSLPSANDTAPAATLPFGTASTTARPATATLAEGTANAASGTAAPIAPNAASGSTRGALVPSAVDAANAAGWVDEPLPAADDSELQQADSELGSLADRVAADGDSATATQLRADQAELTAAVRDMQANGVSAADIDELSALHGNLLDLADRLDAEGLHEEAAEARALAAEVAQTIADLTADEAAADIEPASALGTADDSGLRAIHSDLAVIAAQVAAAGDPASAAELMRIHGELGDELTRMESEGVTAASIAELASFRDQLLGIADQLDAEGLHSEAAAVRTLAAAMDQEIADLAAQDESAEEAAGDEVAAADEAALIRAASAAGQTEGTLAQRDTSARVAVASVPSGRTSRLGAAEPPLPPIR
jgi:hypothetical protein